MSSTSPGQTDDDQPFLLTSKLSVPRVPDSVQVRPRLLEQLQSVVRLPLTVLAAPAGAGKTTLLCSAIQHYAWPVAWVSLDEHDSDPARFWSYVLSAIERQQPGSGAAARQLVQLARPPAIETVLTTLLHHLERRTDPLVLVLDDYHVISSADIHTALRFLVEHLPAQLHLVIATRADPPLPLARQRARRQLLEIRADQLRFRGEETATFLQLVSGLQLSAEAIAALEQRTEGWIAGLQLAALSLQGHANPAAFITTFTGSHRYIADYLIEEVLANQDAALRDFLLTTSILSRMQGTLCAAVSDQPDGQAMLERLEQANMFLQPLDDERRWYRYHQLFRDVLAMCLRRDHPEQIPLLHQRASQWYEQQQLFPEAIHHALAGADFGRAGELIAQIAAPLSQHGEMHTLRLWMEQLPADVIASQPALQIMYCWQLFLSGQYQALEQQIQIITQRYRIDAAVARSEYAPADPWARRMQGEIAALQASIAIIQGDRPRTLALATQALSYLSEDTMAAALVSWYMGMTGWMSDDLAIAAQ